MNSIAAINGIMPGMDAVIPPSPVSVTSKSDVDFISLISKGLSSVDNNITSAETAMNTYALEGNISTHDMMITLEKAKFSLQVAVEVRNRFVEAYSELTRMQI